MFNPKVVCLGCTLLIVGAQQGHAASCDNSSLSGVYPFTASGYIMGVYDAAGTFHLLAAPQPLSGVGQYTFDGKGTFTRVDYNVGNGVPTNTTSTPVNGSGFRTGQTGTYEIADDCTGTLALSASGATIAIQLVVADYGLSARGIVAAEQVPGFNPALLPAGTTCDSGCTIGVNVLTDFKKDVTRRGQ